MNAREPVDGASYRDSDASLDESQGFEQARDGEEPRPAAVTHARNT